MIDFPQSKFEYNLWVKFVCIPNHFFPLIWLWVNSSLICIIVLKVHFQNQYSKGWYLIYKFDTNWYEPQLELQVPAGNVGREEASKYISFECKVFCSYGQYLFRSKAQLMFRNWEKSTFLLDSVPLPLYWLMINILVLFWTKLKNKSPNLQI